MRPVPDRRLRHRLEERDDDGRHRLLPAGGERIEARDGADGEIEANIPARALRELARILTGEGVDAAAITLQANQAIFEAGSITLTTRLIDGQFPNYRQLLPESYEHDVRLPAVEVPRCRPADQPAGATQRTAAILLRAR